MRSLLLRTQKVFLAMNIMMIDRTKTFESINQSINQSIQKSMQLEICLYSKGDTRIF